MSIVVACPCGKSYPIKEEFAGQRVQCPGCKRVLSVPRGVTRLPAPEPPPRARPAAGRAQISNKAARTRHPKSTPGAGLPGVDPYHAAGGSRSSSRGPFIILVILFIMFLAGGAASVFVLLQDDSPKPAVASDGDKDSKNDPPSGGIREISEDHKKPSEPKTVSDPKVRSEQKPPPDQKTPPEQKAPPEQKTRPEQKTPPEQKTRPEQKTPPEQKAPPEQKSPVVQKAPAEPKVPDVPVTTAAKWEGHSARILSVGFPKDGRFALSAAGGLVKRAGQLVPASDSTVRLWDLSTGKEQKRIDRFPHGLSLVAFDPPGDLFVATDAANAQDEAANRPGAFDLHVWEIAGSREVRVLKGHDKIVLCAAFSPDGHQLFSGGRDSRMRIWDVDAGTQLGTGIEHPGFIYGIAVSRDGKFVLTACGDRTIRLYDVMAKKFFKAFPRHQDLVWCVAFSPDGKFAASGGGYDYDASSGNYVVGSKDYDIRLWDVATQKEVRRFIGHTSTVTSVAFSPDGRRLLSGSWDKTVRLWHVPSGRELGRLADHTDYVQTVAFFPDARRALSGGYDRTLRIWPLPPDVGDLAKKLLEPGADRLDLLREIARYGPEAKDSIPALLKLIGDPDIAVKRAAMETLAKVGTAGKEQVELLIPLLKDENFPEGRQLAINVLAGLGADAKPALAELVGLLKDKTPATRTKAIGVIAAIGEDARRTAMAPLLELLADRDADVAKAAAEALPKLGKPTKTELPALIARIADANEAMRRYCILAITELGADAVEAAPVILTALEKDESAELRMLALEALLKVQPDGAMLLAPLTKALSDRDPKIQLAAAEKIAEMPPTTVILPVLLKALAHDNAKVRDVADTAIAKFPFKKEHVKLLNDGLKSNQAKVRLRMLKAVTKLGADGADAVPALIELVKSTNAEEQTLAVNALGNIGPEARDAGPVLAGLLKESEPKSRLAICLVLGKIKAEQLKDALPFLVGLLQVKDAADEQAVSDRKTAADTLIQIGEPAIDELIKALNGDFSGGSTKLPIGKIRAAARIAAMEVIVAIGKKTKEPIRKALLPLSAIEGGDPYPEVRAIAKAARIELQKAK